MNGSVLLGSGGFEGARVLIVEDEFLVALQLEEIATDAGYEVVGIVPDSVSAQAVDRRPDVALVDLNLRDGLSGPAIAWLLSERYGTAVIYVTANPAQIDRPAPTAVGVVQKPFSHECIVTAIELALDRNNRLALAPKCEIYSFPLAERCTASAGESIDHTSGQLPRTEASSALFAAAKTVRSRT